MKTTAQSRELITIWGDEMYLRGTYHRCADDDSAGDRGGKRPIGILLLNYGTTPRSGPGDSLVHWADSFSKLGYPSFRFDLPGLGDSTGELPKDVLGYVSRVTASGYTRTVSGIVETITDRFGLQGVIIAGICAGAVAGLFAAVACEKVEGLLLFTPYFFLQNFSTARETIHRWGVESRVGRVLRVVYRHVKPLVRRTALPPNANVPLIRCWQRIASRELPVFVWNRDENLGNFDYMKYLRANSPRGNIVYRRVDFPSFVEGIGRHVVQQELAGWLRDHFPVIQETPAVEEPVTCSEDRRVH